MLEALYTQPGDAGKQTVLADCNNNVIRAPDYAYLVRGGEPSWVTTFITFS